ncbi:hypothetical protein [Nocardia sp. NPDC004711]
MTNTIITDGRVRTLAPDTPEALVLSDPVGERCAIDELVCAAKTYAVAAVEWCGTK